jgi:hypothetical protein
MDDIWKNAAKKLRARNAAVQSTPALTTGATMLHQKPTTFTMTPNWCDPEHVTLEQIDENSCRLQRDWPKEDGIPFPPDMLETFSALKVAVIARDTRQAEAAALKKAEKKRRLREKRATVHISASPTVIANPPATATIVSTAPTTADCSPNRIGVDITTAISKPCTNASAPPPPNISPDAYSTAHPEQLCKLLITAPPTLIDRTADLREIVPSPADYSLDDIEMAIRKIRKRNGRMGTPVPESIEENADLLRRAV